MSGLKITEKDSWKWCIVLLLSKLQTFLLSHFHRPLLNTWEKCSWGGNYNPVQPNNSSQCDIPLQGCEGVWQYSAQPNLVICVETFRESYSSFRAKYLGAREAIQTYLQRFSVQKYLNYRSRRNKLITTSWYLDFFQPRTKISCRFPASFTADKPLNHLSLSDALYQSKSNNKAFNEPGRRTTNSGAD